MFIEPKDLHLRLVFSPCLCAYLRPLESPQEEETGNLDSGHWLCVEYIAHLVDFAHFLLLCRIGDILRQRGATPTSCRSDAEVLATTWTRTSIFLEAATSSDRLARVTWPPDQPRTLLAEHLTTWPPDQPRTLLAEHLSHLLLKREGFWGKPVGFYLIHRKRQVGSERSQTFRTLRLELETWELFKANPSLTK